MIRHHEARCPSCGRVERTKTTCVHCNYVYSNAGHWYDVPVLFGITFVCIGCTFGLFAFFMGGAMAWSDCGRYPHILPEQVGWCDTLVGSYWHLLKQIWAALHTLW